jgi:riboflavin synthase
MFTGIVETTGEVVGVERTDDGRRLAVAAGDLDAGLHEGQSIGVSGACLTVERHGDDVDPASPASDGVTAAADPDGDRSAGLFEVFLARETVEKTYLGDLGPGDAVNIERAMPADGRFDGHLVQGHVDTVAEVRGIDRVGEDWRFEFGLPGDVGRYVVRKGSIAVDGISLTVAERDADRFSVAIIPTTYDVTTLSEKAVGDPVHLETDVIAKYVENMLDGYVGGIGAGGV